VTTQRVAAVVLTVLMLALVLVGCVAIGRALGSATGGWVVGAMTCVAMVVGWLRQKPAGGE
jgi:hypothetical protein